MVLRTKDSFGIDKSRYDGLFAHNCNYKCVQQRKGLMILKQVRFLSGSLTKGTLNDINVDWNGTFSKRTRNTGNCIRTSIYRYCDFGFEKEIIKSTKIRSQNRMFDTYYICKI